MKIQRRPAIDNLVLLDVAAKEWFGMLGYWLGGRSSALFRASEVAEISTVRVRGLDSE